MYELVWCTKQLIPFAWITAGLCPACSICVRLLTPLKTVYFKPGNILGESLQHYAFLFVFFFSFSHAHCVSTLRDFFPLLLLLWSGYCHTFGIKGPLKRLLLNELDSKSQGVVIWVDMQINISHHQPLVGGARGTGWRDAAHTVIDSDRKRSWGGPV